MKKSSLLKNWISQLEQFRSNVIAAACLAFFLFSHSRLFALTKIHLVYRCFGQCELIFFFVFVGDLHARERNDFQKGIWGRFERESLPKIESSSRSFGVTCRFLNDFYGNANQFYGVFVATMLNVDGVETSSYQKLIDSITL
jgi:hypothetical protein